MPLQRAACRVAQEVPDAMIVISCTDIAAQADSAPYCCSSCHEDEELGYHELSGGWWLDSDDREVVVCCAVSGWLASLPDRGESIIIGTTSLKDIDDR